MTEITDLSPTDSSNTSITGESLNGNIANMGRMDNTIQAVLGMIARSIRSNIFRLLDNTDSTKRAAFGLSRITTATTRTLNVPDLDGTLVLAPMLANYLSGLTLSNNPADTTNDIIVQPGVAADSTNVDIMRLTSALTKRLDAAWTVGSANGGRDTGSIADGTWHIWLIQRSDTGVVDALFSLSATSPTMPANYDRRRRIGSVIRSSSAILQFIQHGDDFWHANAANGGVLDVSVTTTGTTAVTRTLTLPIGVEVDAILNLAVNNSSGQDCVTTVSALELPDVVAGTVAHGAWNTTQGSGAAVSTQAKVRTNASGQIRSRASRSAAAIQQNIATLGWVDVRGRT